MAAARKDAKDVEAEGRDEDCNSSGKEKMARKEERRWCFIEEGDNGIWRGRRKHPKDHGDLENDFVQRMRLDSQQGLPEGRYRRSVPFWLEETEREEGLGTRSYNQQSTRHRDRIMKPIRTEKQETERRVKGWRMTTDRKAAMVFRFRK